MRLARAATPRCSAGIGVGRRPDSACFGRHAGLSGCGRGGEWAPGDARSPTAAPRRLWGRAHPWLQGATRCNCRSPEALGGVCLNHMRFGIWPCGVQWAMRRQCRCNIHASASVRDSFLDFAVLYSHQSAQSLQHASRVVAPSSSQDAKPNSLARPPK